MQKNSGKTSRFLLLAGIALLVISGVFVSLSLVRAGAGGSVICGAKFDDLNGDGQWDVATEPTLPGWTITLQGGGLVTSTVTNVDGYYCFTDLQVNQTTDFIIGEEMQDGWQQTFPPQGIHIVVLQPGQSVDNIHFGNHRGGGTMAGIHGMKFYDADNDGQKDPGEPGLAGWVITLIGSDGLPVTSTTTNENGQYWFVDLVTDTYTISETHQSGWTQTYPPPPGTWTVSYVPSQSIDNLDFGNHIPPGEIHGTKFLDANGNGVQDGNEGGLLGWQIQLQGNNIFSSTFTDQNGEYWFMNLPPGTYQVAEIQPAPVWNGQFMVQWTQTAPPTGTFTIPLDPGEVVIDRDFGNWQNGKNDFCMLPWDNHFLNQTSLSTELYIFNASTDMQKGYNVQFVGATTFTATTSLPIFLNSYQYGMVNVDIAYPNSFTGEGQNIIFQAIVTNLTTNTTFSCSAALWSYSPNWWTSNNVNSGLAGGIPFGFTQNISFTVTNNGGGGGLLLPGGGNPVHYTIMAMSRGMTDTAVVSLNGLPPGSVITGEIDIPVGQSIDIPVDIQFIEQIHLAPTDIVFMLDMDGDGNAEAMTSYLALLNPPQAFLPAVQKP